MLKVVIKRNDKIKKAVVISIVLHIILFAVLIWSSFDKHISISVSSERNSSINAIMVNPDMVVQNYNRQKQQEITVKHTEEQHKKQVQKVIKKRAEQHKQEGDSVAKVTADTKSRTNIQNEKTAEVRKKMMISSDIDNLFSNLSSDKNAPKIGSEAKENKKWSTSNGNTNGTNTLSADISNYAEQIKSAIESRFYDASYYVGKTCTLRIKLDSGGMLFDIKSEGGDPALCKAAIAAARQAKIPKPPSQAAHEVFKNALLDFKP